MCETMRETSALTSTPPPAWSDSLLDMLATARQEITAHDNDQGLCSVCGSAFPCERAELAAFALDAL